MVRKAVVKALAKAKAEEVIHDRHRRQVVCFTLLVALGGVMAYAGLHGSGLVVEVMGLILVSLVD